MGTDTTISSNDISISSNDIGTWTAISLPSVQQYTLRSQSQDTIGNGIEDKPPVCTQEEWDKFCEEEGLENAYADNSAYTNW